jgi:2-C-methyl-D-erythritol 2,4-cyclodiphosphate synthase
MFRVGFGYDVHRLRKGRLILGGVEVPFEKGLVGFSDADVLCHAIGDALLGSLGLGDLGKHFPDSDERFKNVSSLKILSMIKEKIKEQNAEIVNVDSTVVAQEPKLSPYIEKMRANISQALGIKKQQVSIKATTTEGLGFTGQGEGMAAFSVVLIERK